LEAHTLPCDEGFRKKLCYTIGRDRIIFADHDRDNARSHTQGRVMTLRAYYFIVVSLGLAGCSVGPDYQKPPSDAVASWDGPATDNAWPSENWWSGFQIGDLDQLMRDAKQANLDLRVAVARLKQANAQAVISGAPLLPSLSASASAERIRQQPSYRKGTNSYGGSLIASYQLDFWGALADQAEAARLTALATQFDRETAELTVQSAVADSYFSLLSLNERIALAEQNIRASAGILDAYHARFEVGTASQLDLAQQQNVLEEQRAALPPLLEQQRQSRDALAVLVGRLPEQVTAPVGQLAAVRLPAISAGLPSGLLARRPDVQSAEAQLRAANQNVKAATAALFPTIGLTAQGGGLSSALSGLFEPAGAFYVLSGSVSQPIFKNGALQAGIDLATGQYDQQWATYRKTVISAFAEVEDALISVEMEGRRETAERAAVATAQQAYDIAQEQLRYGTIDLLTVLNTQRSLFQAEDSLAQARLTHAQAVVGLFIALGGGWQSPEEG
jgi:NodT family efflux transporter outer membrane factor (OMF) lipoprotein